MTRASSTGRKLNVGVELQNSISEALFGIIPRAPKSLVLSVETYTNDDGPINKGRHFFRVLDGDGRVIKTEGPFRDWAARSAEINVLRERTGQKIPITKKDTPRPSLPKPTVPRSQRPSLLRALAAQERYAETPARKPDANGCFVYPEITINTLTRKVLIKGEERKISIGDLIVLGLLASKPNVPVSSSQLKEALTKNESPYRTLVRNQVSHLRRSLGAPNLVIGERGIGFMLQVTDRPASPTFNPEAKCQPELTECPRCHNDLSICDQLSKSQE